METVTRDARQLGGRPLQWSTCRRPWEPPPGLCPCVVPSHHGPGVVFVTNITDGIMYRFEDQVFKTCGSFHLVAILLVPSLWWGRGAAAMA